MHFKALMKHYCGVEDAPYNKLYGDRTFEEWSQNEFKEIFCVLQVDKDNFDIRDNWNLI